MSTITEQSKLLAVDPSLTASGWAVFSLETGAPFAVGVISPPGPKTQLSVRLDCLHRDVVALLSDMKMGEGDFLVCEGPAPLVRNPQSALKVEQVRSIFESVGRSFSVRVPGRLNPRTVQTELLGMRGKQCGREEVKAWARETANRLYGDVVYEVVGGDAGAGADKGELSQDIVDALLVGSLAVSKIQLCLQSGVDVSSAFATVLARRRWGGRGRVVGWTEAEGKKFIGS